MVTNAKISEITTNNNNPVSVKLEGSEIPTDLLVMATGVRPVIDFVEDLTEK